MDGGFGTNPGGDHDGVVANGDGSFGNGQFNTPSLIEFADTLPAFHNNITAGPGLANTVEGAIEFYLTDEFKDSPAGGFGTIVLSETQVTQIGKFLRVLNALHNEESVTDVVGRALELLSGPRHIDLKALRSMIGVAIADSLDARRVLTEAGLHLDAGSLLTQAITSLEAARGMIHMKRSLSPLQKLRVRRLLKRTLRLMVRTRAIMVTETE